MVVTIKHYLTSRDGTLTGTTTLNQSGSESNGNKRTNEHSPELQNCNLTARYNI